ncbi:MAG: NTP transferase domain-containing protein [bacterium]
MARADWAVILARGDSSRMGRPKGLCRLPGDDRCFLALIAAAYQAIEFPVAVVTTCFLGKQYRAALSTSASPEWIERAGGGGTAASVVAALEMLVDRATHIWLHPVDLPGVAADSLARLLAESRRHPASLLVPEYAGQPGHPVVLPVGPFLGLCELTVPESMRPWLLEVTASGPDQMAPLVPVPLRDRGIVTDYDSTDDFG